MSLSKERVASIAVALARDAPGIKIGIYVALDEDYLWDVTDAIEEEHNRVETTGAIAWKSCKMKGSESWTEFMCGSIIHIALGSHDTIVPFKADVAFAGEATGFEDPNIAPWAVTKYSALVLAACDRPYEQPPPKTKPEPKKSSPLQTLLKIETKTTDDPPPHIVSIDIDRVASTMTTNLTRTAGGLQIANFETIDIKTNFDTKLQAALMGWVFQRPHLIAINSHDRFGNGDSDANAIALVAVAMMRRHPGHRVCIFTQYGKRMVILHERVRRLVPLDLAVYNSTYIALPSVRGASSSSCRFYFGASDVKEPVAADLVIVDRSVIRDGAFHQKVVVPALATEGVSAIEFRSYPRILYGPETATGAVEPSTEEKKETRVPVPDEPLEGDGRLLPVGPPSDATAKATVNVMLVRAGVAPIP